MKGAVVGGQGEGGESEGCPGGADPVGRSLSRLSQAVGGFRIMAYNDGDPPAIACLVKNVGRPDSL